jgi:hypothetical protein
MSRNQELEDLLQAKFDLDYCANDQREAFLRRFQELLDQTLARTGLAGVTRSELEETLREPYREFRRSKLLEERARLSRLR